jgi:hypothetical protein
MLLMSARTEGLWFLSLPGRNLIIGCVLSQVFMLVLVFTGGNNFVYVSVPPDLLGYIAISVVVYATALDFVKIALNHALSDHTHEPAVPLLKRKHREQSRNYSVLSMLQPEASPHPAEGVESNQAGAAPTANQSAIASANRSRALTTRPSRLSPHVSRSTSKLDSIPVFVE